MTGTPHNGGGSSGSYCGDCSSVIDVVDSGWWCRQRIGREEEERKEEKVEE